MIPNVVLERILSSVVFPREVITQAEHMLRAEASCLPAMRRTRIKGSRRCRT